MLDSLIVLKLSLYLFIKTNELLSRVLHFNKKWQELNMEKASRIAQRLRVIKR